MEARKPKGLTYVPAALLEITTPLISWVWEQELHFTQISSLQPMCYINGIKHGLRVGYDRTHSLFSSTRIMASALDHPEVVSDYLEQEKLVNHMVVMSP